MVNAIIIYRTDRDQYISENKMKLRDESPLSERVRWLVFLLLFVIILMLVSQSESKYNFSSISPSPGRDEIIVRPKSPIYQKGINYNKAKYGSANTEDRMIFVANMTVKVV